ncbi:MAG: type IX secretion system membrane protein PorP/SprF [Bacteroidales bacterium]
MKKLITILALFTCSVAIAQQDALFSQYMFNKVVLNAGYTGSREVMSADLTDRYQWVGIEGAPKTITFSMHSPLRNEHIGIGFYVYRDELGPTLDQGFLASYAYRLILPKGKLSFGIQAGFKYFNIDWNKIDEEVRAADYMFQGTQQNKFTPDANFGIYYYTNRIFAGVSSKQLLQNEYGMVKVDGKSSYSKLLRHFYGMAGMAVPVSDEVLFRPSTLIKYVKNAPLQVDLNASFLIKELFWLGITYRTENALVFLTEFNLAKNLRLGYSYDVYLNQLVHYNKGSHEIRLGFDLDLFRNRMLTPRYF